LRLISGLLVVLSALGLHGCLYGFAGGGLPPSIETVAVLPFDNQTPEPTLTQEISQAVREAVESRLGLRQAAEQQADAVVKGSITRYEPDLPVAYTGADTVVTVTRREVQITV
jgi:Lipopolysaccharide-assembly